MNRILQVLDIASITYDEKIYNGTAVNDKNEPFWVEFARPHFNEIGVDLKLLTLNEIDKSKNWIINLDIKAWEWYPCNEVFESLGTEILNEIKYGNAYIILNHQCESQTNRFFINLYQKAGKGFPFPFNKIMYMVGAADAEREYRIFVKENDIPKENQIRILYTHHVYKRFHSDVQRYEIDYFNNKNKTLKKEKKFLSLNRRGHDHRILLVSSLVSANLMEHGYVSLGLYPDDLPLADHQIFYLTKDEINMGYIKESFDTIRDQVPLRVDSSNLKVNLFGTTSLPMDFYQQSCFSLVSSTCGIQRQEKSVGFTEKEVKPILARHPFIIYNLSGALEHLKSMGFLTFERWFDESYDLETNDRRRLEKIIKEVARLSAISFEDWEIMLEEMKPVLDHNHNRMVKYTTEHCYFNSDLKKLLYYVS